MGEQWRIALVDSGVTATAGFRVAAARRFIDVGDEILDGAPLEDATGHGTAIADIIGTSGKEIDWIVAQVFDARSRATAASIAGALSWVLSQQVHLIHLSLGLQHDRRVLAEAIVRALGASVTLVASSPARGDATYPAAYPGVIRATGDARCAPHELSLLGTRQADYGSCSQYRASSGRLLRGASIGAAHVSRFIVHHASPGVSGPDLRRLLQELAVHRGPERRVG